MAAFARNVWMVSSDYYGTPLDKLPIMSGLKTLTDFKLIITYLTADMAVRQLYSTYKVPMILGGRAVMIPGQMPYFTSGQLVSILNDAVGAAEYEVLLQQRGYGLTFLDGLTTVAMLMIGVIILTNVIYHANRRTTLDR